MPTDAIQKAIKETRKNLDYLGDRVSCLETVLEAVLSEPLEDNERLSEQEFTCDVQADIQALDRDIRYTIQHIDELIERVNVVPA